MAAFEEKLRRFNLEDTTYLKLAGKHLIPKLDEVLATFYERALADPEARGYFENDGRVQSARNAQRKHWEKLLSGDFDASYFASTERIGRTHARIDLPLEIYLSAYACAGSQLTALLLQKLSGGFLRSRNKNTVEIIGALSRALAFDIERVVDITFTVWGEEQKTAFAHLEQGIDALAGGDMTHVIKGPRESDYPAAYDDVRVKFNAAIANLRGLVSNVAGALDNLRGVINTVTKATDEMSQRTVSQAASLEETAAAMSQLSQSVTISAQKTDATSKVGQSARDEVNEGARIISEAASAMSAIQETSENISHITVMIDDVAFQTNLLALNAGVEAARAGEAGRGFAVVASEVRSLAVRSSEAARDIKELIGTSSRSVDEGVGLIKKATLAFEDIVARFDEVTSLTSDVAAASKEQSLGLGEVNTTVNDMDRTTQLNAGVVTETLQSMQDMATQASGLQRLVDKLNYDNEGPRRLHAGRDSAAA